VTETRTSDNCQCSQCVNQDTLQRNFDTFQIDAKNLEVTSSQYTDGALAVNWSDGHKSHYPAWWVKKAKQSLTPQNTPPSVWDTVELWNHEQAAGYRKKQEVPYDPSSSNDCLREATARLNRYGYCFITGVPAAPEPTEALLEQFGPIRNTHYGGFYDFTPDLAKADTAYTNIALPPHTDTTYFTEPAGLQSFHMLSHEGPRDADGDLGGSSILVDGFAAASKLYHEHRDAFDCLSKVPIPWHASGNQGVTITPAMRAPVIEFVQSGYGDDLLRIRWNNDDRGVVPIEKSDEWYAAARIWDSILKDKEMQYHFQLEPGTVLIFDNWRVLHGRTAFEGIRRMSGAYINRDDYFSTKINSQLTRDEVQSWSLFQDRNNLVESSKRIISRT